MASSSFKANLKFGGNTYPIIASSFGFSQAIDKQGRPSSGVHSGGINITIVAGADEKLLEWMVTSDKQDQGSIVWNKIDAESSLKELKFEDAYCVGFNESFAAETPDSMLLNISITARKITVGNVAWEDTDW